MEIKKIIITAPLQAELQTSEEELVPNSREILVKTDASYISAGTESSIFTASELGVYNEGCWCKYPYNSGYANAGIVVAIGDNVKEIAIGDKIFSNSPHRSHAILNIDASLWVKIPEGISQDVAAASRMAGVATSALLLSQHVWHPWVVIFGLGSVGNLAAQSFKISGCRVVGIDPLSERRKIAHQCGIECLLENGIPENIKAVCNGEMPQIVVDATGLTPVIMSALQVTAGMGQLLLLGSPRQPFQGNITEFLADVHARNITVKGALEWFLPLKPVKSIFGGNPPQTLSMIEKQQMIFDWIISGQMQIEPLISHYFNPAEAQSAYNGLLEHPDKCSGVIFNWRDI